MKAKNLFTFLVHVAFVLISMAETEEIEYTTESPSIEVTTMTMTETVETIKEDLDDDIIAVESSPLTPKISGNVVTNLVPSLMKNMKEASEASSEGLEEVTDEEKQEIDAVIKTRDMFKKRNTKKANNLFRSSAVKNSTAAEILLKKVQEGHNRKTYHDPGYR